MTKKDYAQIAEAMRQEKANAIGVEARLQVLSCIFRLAEVMAADNPRFNKARFIVAAGWGDR